MTSLARQLQSLAVSYTQTVLGEDKRRVSLLFDPKEAANIDRDTVFALGFSGLEELETFDSEFAQFEENLFSQAGIDWERSLQTQEANDRLDATLSNFLIRLSPLLPLRASHKALEWLIYRYHIHQFNIDIIMLCCLPYHDTNIFTRIVQLLPISKANSKWHWLHPAAKAGTPLARSTLVNHCRQDPAFLSFVCEIVPKFIKVHGASSRQLQAAVALSTCVTLGCLQNRNDISERLVSVVVAQVVAGCRSHFHDYRASAYMILGQLAVHATLKESLVETLLTLVTKHILSGLSFEAIQCLNVVCQTQNVTKLPKKCFRQLRRVPSVTHLIAQLSHRCHATALLRLWLDCLVTVVTVSQSASTSGSETSENAATALAEPAELLLAAMDEVTMETALATHIAKKAFDRMLHLRLGVSSEAREDDDELLFRWRQLTQRLLTVLERRHPTSLQAVLADSVSSTKHSPALLAALHEATTLTGSAICHEPVADTSTSLAVGLRAADTHVRLAATLQLTKHLEEGHNLPAEFVKAEVLERLTDDNNDIVCTILKLKERLVEFVDKETLTEKLLKLVNEAPDKERRKDVVPACLSVLSSEALSGGLPDLLIVVLPHLLVAEGDDLSVVRDLLQTPATCSDTGLGSTARSWLIELDRLQSSGETDSSEVTATTAAQLNCGLVHGLATALKSCSAEDRSHLISALVSRCDSLGQARFSLILVCTLVQLLTLISGEGRSNKFWVNESLAVAHCLLQVLKSLRTRQKKKKSFDQSAEPSDLTKCDFVDLFTKWTAQVMRKVNTVPVNLLVWSVQHLVGYVKNRLEVTDDIWTSAEPGSVDGFLVNLLQLILIRASTSRSTDCYMWRLLLPAFFKSISPAASNRVFTFIWTADVRKFTTTDVSQTHCPLIAQLACFHLAAAKWKRRSAAELRQLLQLDCGVLPCLLVSASSEHLAVRRAALACIAQLSVGTRDGSEGDGDDGGTGSLLRKLKKRKEEIVADKWQAAKVLGKCLSTTHEKSPKRKKISKTDGSPPKSLQQILHWTTSSDTPLYMKERLLSLLSNVDIEVVFTAVMPLVNNAVAQLTRSTDTATSPTRLHLDLLAHVLSRYDPQVAALLTQEHEAFELLLLALRADVVIAKSDETAQKITLRQLTPEFLRSLPTIDCQKRIVTVMLDLVTSTPDAENKTLLHTCLTKMKLNENQVLHEIPGMDMSEVSTVKGQKRARTQKQVAPIRYPRLAALLEVLQSRKNMKSSEVFIARLFSLLNRLLTEDAEEMEYCKQLALTVLYNVCVNWKCNEMPQENFNIEVLVQCIRGSSSPQSQQMALLIMASIAHLFPKYILHNVMSIFTFMGENLLAQDDSYSLQIITKTMNTIIPAIIKAESTGSDGNDEDVTAAILCVFVDARTHVPRHRCTPLFSQLLTALQNEEREDTQRNVLAMLLVMLLDASVRSKDVPLLAEARIGDEKLATPIDRDIELAVSICNDFTNASGIVNACTHVLRMLQTLISEHQRRKEATGQKTARGQKKKKKRSSHADLDLIHADTLTDQQLRMLQYHMTRLVVTLIDTDTFIAQVVRDSGIDTVVINSFRQFVPECLRYLTDVTRSQQNATEGSTVTKFWKALLHKTYDILEKVNYLLPMDAFLEVVTPLLTQPLPSICKKALELLGGKLQPFTSNSFSDKETELLLVLVQQLITMATVSPTASDNDALTVQQMALYVLKLLCRLLGCDYPKEFLKMFDVAVSIMTKQTSAAVVASALLCLAEACSSLRAHIIAQLSLFVPPLMSILEDNGKLGRHELVMTCALTALQRLLGSLPHFVSPYLKRILLTVCQLSAYVSADAALSKSQCSLRLNAIRQQMATLIEPRVLLPAMTECHHELVKVNPVNLTLLMKILTKHVTVMAQEDISCHHSTLVTFLLLVLDIRNTQQQLSEDKMDTVENSILEAVVAMVVRLSENTFRPMFYKLFDWACRDDADIVFKKRKLTFFKLAERLSERLKSLFNLFIGHTIQTAAKLLKENNSLHSDGSSGYFGSDELAVTYSCRLINHIMGCLHKCMLYDTDGFMTPDIFKLLMQPLVDQLENCLGGEAVTEDRIQQFTMPCISQLAVATHDDTCWKTLNYQVLLKTRHSSAKVRFAALKTIEDVAKKLGDEYMSLLPETIPFLAELMEDESEEVEQLCQAVIGSVEEVLGESLQKYF